MTKREAYFPNPQGLSRQNEPATDILLSGYVRKYPDMFYAYRKFQQLFALPDDSFFLANGCENAMKNVLLALKPKSMVWATPTWRMPEVYAAALDFKLITKSYIFDYRDNSFHLPQDFYQTEADVLYDNFGITTCFMYNFDINKLASSKATYNIIDLTYRSFEDMQEFISLLTTKPYGGDKNIIIGSFDKLVGGALRLGFAIFPQKLKDAMALQREQYINLLAFNYLLDTEEFNYYTPYKDKLSTLLENIPGSWLTDNFLTVKGDIETALPCYKFSVSGFDFTRFGIPSNIEEYRALEVVLKDLIYVKN